MLSLTDFFLLSHLKHQHPKKPQTQTSPSNTPASGLSAPQTHIAIVIPPSPDTRNLGPTPQFNFSRQVGQRGPMNISNEYTNECQIFMFELAYICGHHELSSFLMELYIIINQNKH
jgi:hypothetical protein